MGIFNSGYGGGGGGGFSPRLLIGLAIAAVGLFSYFMIPKTKNEYTGREQRIKLSVDQEIQLGINTAPQMAQQMNARELAKDDPRMRRVADIGSRVVRGSTARSAAYPFNFHVIDDRQTVNAFALPGGPVFITTGLLDRMTRDDQIAGVLGHEVGHVLARHSAEQMAQRDLGSKLSIAAGIAASDRDARLSALALVANQMIQLKYSRDDESEADSEGMELMNEAGYDPAAMLEVMEILKQVSGRSSTPEFLQTHPAPDTRIQRIQQILREKYNKQIDPKRGMDGTRG